MHFSEGSWDLPLQAGEGLSSGAARGRAPQGAPQTPASSPGCKADRGTVKASLPSPLAWNYRVFRPPRPFPPDGSGPWRHRGREPDGAHTAGKRQPQLPGESAPEAPQLLATCHPPPHKHTTKLLALAHRRPPQLSKGWGAPSPCTPPTLLVIPASRGRSQRGILLNLLKSPPGTLLGGVEGEVKGPGGLSFCPPLSTFQCLSTSQCRGTSGMDWSKVGAGKKVSQVHVALPDSLLFPPPPQVQ